MSRSWLQRKRKGELIELAQLARIPKYALCRDTVPSCH